MGENKSVWCDLLIYTLYRGYTPVKQDFYAKIVATNLTAILSIAAQKKSDKETQQRDFRYQINFARALSKMKHTIIKRVTQSGADLTALIRKSINYISKTIEPVREGRFAPGGCRILKNDIHSSAYKHVF